MSIFDSLRSKHAAASEDLFQYGVAFLHKDGHRDSLQMRWRNCWDAVDFAQKALDEEDRGYVSFRIIRETVMDTPPVSRRFTSTE
jgi:hypothetical protein